jgi:2-polyprenyl-3-methyl-5-hydroxy-6-metoxy-1,4-benzoquinol methylase
MQERAEMSLRSKIVDRALLCLPNIRTHVGGRLARIGAKIAVATGKLVWGGSARERLLVYLLDRHYQSKFLREWYLSGNPPHHSDMRMTGFALTYRPEVIGPYLLFRGFYSVEVLGGGEVLLDLGCGDGFFAKRFFAPRCSHVDAIDIDQNAIEEAKTFNPDPKVHYHLLDATKDRFPRDKYDVVVWDGAIGHFCADDCRNMLVKISASLGSEGIFVGSEALGHEGADHLQYFEDVRELHALFRPHFEFVELRTERFPIRPEPGAHTRVEAYWRCYNKEGRLNSRGWKRFDI